MTETEKSISTAMSRLDAMIESAPAGQESAGQPGQARKNRISLKTGLGDRYRDEWDRPSDDEWARNFCKINEAHNKGAILAIIGPRGTGKTRLAAEAIREVGESARYATAMNIFLRVRESYGKSATESELDIVKELSRCPLLVIDEIQERGNSQWEDRILTHIIDNRYSNLRCTVIIANMTSGKLIENVGPSIADRMNEAGGIIELKGASRRE